jgi:hypothetical protein
MKHGFTVVLKGAAGPTSRAAFSGLEVSVENGRTTITGILPDQAALFGVLERAQDLGLSVLEVLPPPEGLVG